jgi:hypothetical protein
MKIHPIFLHLLSLLTLTSLASSHCMHDHFAHKIHKHYYNDFEGRRLQQETESGRYSFVAIQTQDICRL